MIPCIGKGKAGPHNSVMRLPFNADGGQTGANTGTELALWEFGIRPIRGQEILRNFAGSAPGTLFGHRIVPVPKLQVSQRYVDPAQTIILKCD
jgi:hypothetical protein